MAELRLPADRTSEKSKRDARAGRCGRRRTLCSRRRRHVLWPLFGQRGGTHCGIAHRQLKTRRAAQRAALLPLATLAYFAAVLLAASLSNRAAKTCLALPVWGTALACSSLAGVPTTTNATMPMP